jgi:hypothetical protein
MREAALLSDVGKLNFVGTLGNGKALPETLLIEGVHALLAELIMCVCCMLCCCWWWWWCSTMGFSPCYVVEKIVEYPCEKDVVHSLSPSLVQHQDKRSCEDRS